MGEGSPGLDPGNACEEVPAPSRPLQEWQCWAQGQSGQLFHTEDNDVCSVGSGGKKPCVMVSRILEAI